MSKRKSITKKLRFQIFERDNFNCKYCGKGIESGIVLEVDHIIPVSEGGGNELENLITSCFDCNRGKSNKVLLTQNSISKIKSSKKLEEEKSKQIDAYFKYLKKKKENEEKICQKALGPLYDLGSEFTNERYIIIPSNWKKSILFFIDKLDIEDVFCSAEIASFKFRPMGQYKFEQGAFNYFCGICHRKIKERETSEEERRNNVQN